MTPSQPNPIADREKLDIIAEVACLFMGFTPNAYWKKAVLDQHPDAVAKSSALFAHTLEEKGVEARVDEAKLMQDGDVDFQRYSEERIVALTASLKELK